MKTYRPYRTLGNQDFCPINIKSLMGLSRRDNILVDVGLLMVIESYRDEIRILLIYQSYLFLASVRISLTTSFNLSGLITFTSLPKPSKRLISSLLIINSN